MDTKLKNKPKKIGTLLVLLLLVIPSVIMISLYPYFEKQAKENMATVESTMETNMEDNYFLLEALKSSNYVLYGKARSLEAGMNLTPWELFFSQAGSASGITSGTADDGDDSALMDERTDDMETETDISEDAFPDENYLSMLRQNLNEDYENWNNNFSSVDRFLSYTVRDAQGKMILTTGEEPLSVEAPSDSSYALYVTFSYDSIGNLTVSSYASTVMPYAKSAIQSYFNEDPLYDYYDSTFLYDRAATFQQPAGYSFTYAITASDYDALMEENGYYIEGPWNEYEAYINYSPLLLLTLTFLGLMVLAALLLPKTGLWTYKGKRLYHLPLELVLFVLCCYPALVGNYRSMLSTVVHTNRGTLYEDFQRLIGVSEISTALVYLYNLALWMTIFFIIFWAAASLAPVFSMGIKAYLSEYCWCYRNGAKVIAFCKKVLNSLADIDFRERSNKAILKIVLVNFLIMLIICSLWFFGTFALIVYSVVLFFILRKYYDKTQEKYERLLKLTGQLADGNLDANLNEDLGVFNPIKEELEKIQTGFKKAVDEEVKSQRMKTELITNVSHDLKTPLTAIITYVNLLKEENITEEERASYIQILEQKSMRLKVLIEDLFEVSKATSNNITLNLMEVDIVNLLKQVRLELSDKIEASGLDFRWDLPEARIPLTLDSQKTYRVFENLIVNIVKYALSGSRVYISMNQQQDHVVITMKNISASELNFAASEITERFVRGDQSRNTEGSGLGLAIAKSFVELQKGTFEVQVDGDLFKVIITWAVENV